MMLRILMLCGGMAWLAAAQAPVCHPVQGDQIRVQDLAAVLPEFLPAPPLALLGQAPVPGAQRIFHASELTALAHRFGLTLSSTPDTCFEWPLQAFDRERALAVMQESLHMPDAKIEITDAIAAHVPAGRMEFPMSSLGVPSASGPSVPVVWRGDIIYGASHRFPIWVRVAIAAPCRKLIAADTLTAGKPIEAHQLRASTGTCFPIASKEMPPVEVVAGMSPLRSIPAGTELRQEMLLPANDVNRGETVHIEVRSGAARLAFIARALTGGRTGETISVRNPDSNKTFPARVTGKGTALVEAGTPRGI